MGFFKGKGGAEAAPATGRARRGTQAPGEAAEDLQRRARRRLLGAVAMVLAAVIVLPLLLDAEPEAVSSGPVAIHIPGQDSPFEPQLTPSRPEPVIADPVPDERPADLPVTAPVAARPPASLSVSPPEPAQPPRQTPPAATQPPRTTTPPATPPAQPATRPTTPPATPPATAARPADNNDAQRRAEAERALSLLQGRGTPATGSNASGGSGRFAVQVVAVRSRSGADSLLDQLRGAGLPAYIETVSSPAGEVHRVRLGPFTSRSQAESAQARLQNLPGGNRGSLVPL